ncbi:MAG: hypothetical protein FWD59_04245 [Micrococcales bacterium]|nr:hypothetical protein [Micrococcales bacterium]
MSALPIPTTRRTLPTPKVFGIPAPRRRRGTIGFVAACVVLLIGSLVTVLWLNTAQTEGSFVEHKLRVEMADLADRRAAIVEDLSSRGAPAVLSERARELGMIGGKNLSYLQLVDGKIIGDPAPAGVEPEEAP